MTTLETKIHDFLAQNRIAVVGVSRDDSGHPAANLIYRKLRSEGYKVVAVNPNATIVEGDISYPNLRSVSEKPEAVVIVTKPGITEQVVRECAELSIANIWMHKGIDSKGTSVSKEAVHYCHQHGITVIPGGCPMMYCNHADIGHRVMRWMLSLKRFEFF